jgi:hypothetical protein
MKNTEISTSLHKYKHGSYRISIQVNLTLQPWDSFIIIPQTTQGLTGRILQSIFWTALKLSLDITWGSTLVYLESNKYTLKIIEVQINEA